MAYDPIASRYAEALLASAAAAGRVDDALDQTALLGQLCAEHAGLRQFMNNPDVDPDQKLGLLERALGASWSPLLSSFLAVVISRGREASLPAIAEAFRDLVDARRGLVRVTVRSAHPLPAEAVTRLRSQVEARERKRVELRVETDPGLLGGLQIIIGHRVIDGSVRRQLAELRERLVAARVN